MRDSAFSDIIDSFARWGIWWSLGISDTAAKYRRSILGPFWITLGMSITVTGLATFWSLIWKVDLNFFFPYLTAGLIIWNFIVAALVEGSVCFVQQASVIRAAPLPLFIFPLRLAVKLAITMVHNLVVFFGVVLFFDVPITIASWLFFPGLLVLFGFVLSVSLLLGIISARYRDFPPIIESLVPLIFFLTPVLWFSSALGDMVFLANLNPLTHLIAVVREPMLGNYPTQENYLATVAFLTVLWLAAILVFSRCRERLSVWI